MKLFTLATFSSLIIAAVSPSNTIYQNLVELNGSGNFNLLFEKLDQITGVRDLLQNANNQITFFAPTNISFVNRGELNSSLIEPVMYYHVLSSSVDTLPNANSLPVTYTTYLTGLVAGNQSGLLPADKKQVVSLQSETLQTRVGFGGRTEATITDSIQCSNGMLYVINAVMLPPQNFASTILGQNMTAFVNVLDLAQVTDSVLSSGGITVFGSMDTAVDRTNLESLSTSDQEGVMKYHLVPQVKYINQLTNELFLETMQGTTIKISVRNGVTYVNGYRIVKSNLLMRNGVLHLIDGFLDPKSGKGSSVVNDNQPEIDPGKTNPDEDAPTESSASSLNNSSYVLFIVMIITVFLNF